MKKLLLLAVSAAILSGCAPMKPAGCEKANALASCKYVQTSTAKESLTQPAYPAVAQARGIEGSVRIKYDINESGKVENLVFLSSTPSNVFDREVEKAVKNWRFADQQPKKGEIRTIDFSLKGGAVVRPDDSALINSHAAAIRKAIQDKFYDPEAFAGKQCNLTMKFTRDGNLEAVRAEGGDPALCQAVIAASKAATFPAIDSEWMYAIFKETRLNFDLKNQ